MIVDTRPESAPATPWRLLTPLDGENPADRRIVEVTREHELNLVSRMVASSRVSILYAYSGNGKTSLIEAGLLPRFRREDYAVFRTRPRPPWSQGDPTLAFKECILRDLPSVFTGMGDLEFFRELRSVVDMVPEKNGKKKESLRSEINRLERLLDSSPVRSELTESVRSDLASHIDLGLVEFLERATGLVGAKRPVLLVCDQFEELFVHYANTEHLERFVIEIGKVWATASLDIHLLFSLREDWVGSLIAFRKTIPEIFNNYFRLSPIPKSRAAKVLTAPLDLIGESFDSNVVERILDDLAASYSRAEQDRFSGIRLERSSTQDPFIELPALQIVGDRLWATRHDHEPAFTLAHYVSLGRQSGSEGSASRVESPDQHLPSPAETILESFVEEAIAAIPAPEGREEEFRDLQIDLLYLLTDGERHRRALHVERLLRELRRIRPSELDLPAPTKEEIRDVLDSLRPSRLVRKLAGASGKDEYELGHDFAVRAVVRAWRRLDRERIQALGRLAKERRAKDDRLKQLEGSQKVVVHTLQAGPILGLLWLLWTEVALFAGLFSIFTQSFPYLQAAVSVSLICLIVLSLIVKHSFSFVALTIGLGLTLSPWMVNYAWKDQLRQEIGDRWELRRSEANELLRSFTLERMWDSLGKWTLKDKDEIGIVVKFFATIQDRLTELSILDMYRLPSAAEELYEEIRVAVYRIDRDLRGIPSGYPSLDIIREELASKFSQLEPGADIDRMRNWIKELSGFLERLHLPPMEVFIRQTSLSQAGGLTGGLTGFAFLAYLSLYVRNLASLSRRFGVSPALGRVCLFLWSDLMSMLILWVVPLSVALTLSPSVFWLAPYLALSFLASVLVIRSWGTTPGLAMGGFRLVSKRGPELTWRQIVVRQGAFFVWTALNCFFLLPWLLVSPFVFHSKGRGVYDLVAGTAPAPAKGTKPSKKQGFSDLKKVA